MMRRCFLTLSVLALCFSASGCGKPSETEVQPKQTHATGALEVRNSAKQPLAMDPERLRLQSMHLGECVVSTKGDQRCYASRTIVELNEEARRQALASDRAEQTQAPSLCWEEYCPCQHPQGGPDQILCDQLRMGNVNPEMLSVGKSMRQVRRDLENYDF